MTARKTRPQGTKHGGAALLQGYLASLLFLREEAMRAGLHVVAQILWDALATLEKWLYTGVSPADRSDILDSSLCRALDFVVKWRGLPPAGQRQVVQDIARYEGEISTGESAPRSRSRANKKTAR